MCDYAYPGSKGSCLALQSYLPMDLANMLKSSRRIATLDAMTKRCIDPSSACDDLEGIKQKSGICRGG